MIIYHEWLIFLKINHLVELYNVPFENFDINRLSTVDIVLTSPPYFNLETYATDDSQSYNKYTDFQDWVDKWLLQVIELCVKKLVHDGLSCWNVMNFNKNDLVDVVIQKHKSLNFEMINAIGIDSPFINYKKRLHKKDLTYIFSKHNEAL